MSQRDGLSRRRDMKTKLPVVVLGGGYAGVLAALRVARQSERPVQLISADSHLVERIRLHECAVRPRNVKHELSTLVRGTNISLLQQTVDRIDPIEKLVYAGSEQIRYEKLIVAIGSGPIRTPFATHSYPTLRCADSMRESLTHLRTIVVLGGGLSGIEYASELAEATQGRTKVILITRTLGAQLSDAAQRYIRATLVRLGVIVREGVTVNELGEREILTSDEKIQFDRCVITTGFRVSPWLTDSGFSVNENGQAIVDPMLRAIGFSDVYIVGDSAKLPVAGAMGCKTAMPMGAHAADNLVRAIKGLHEQPLSYRDTGYCISLGRADGVIQLLDGNAVPTSSIITGRFAAFLKEAICRYTILSLKGERLGIRYRWVSSSKQLGYAPATVAHRLPSATVHQ